MNRGLKLPVVATNLLRVYTGLDVTGSQWITKGTTTALAAYACRADWAPDRRVQDGSVLLVGGAAHPMTPFQGQAANIAMLDAYEVACVLAKYTADRKALDRALAKQERKIRTRGRKEVLQSRETGLDFHLTSKKEQGRRALIFRGANALIQLSVAAKKLWSRGEAIDRQG